MPFDEDMAFTNVLRLHCRNRAFDQNLADPLFAELGLDQVIQVIQIANPHNKTQGFVQGSVRMPQVYRRHLTQS